ncbi:MAG: hypothetical protein OXC53_00965 [Rhodobacteraceae bacterium]|nr:hypothetical protein [Paracoccaceae bacterium]
MKEINVSNDSPLYRHVLIKTRNSPSLQGDGDDSERIVSERGHGLEVARFRDRPRAGIGAAKAKGVYGGENNRSIRIQDLAA